MKNLHKPISLALLSLLLTQQALASECQIVDGATDGVKTVYVSATELTRIAIEGGRILQTIQHKDSSAAIDPDKGSGQAFVTLDRKKPARVFVLSGGNRTHTLQLQPTDDPVSCILIREPAPVPGAPGGPTGMPGSGLPQAPGALNGASVQLLGTASSGPDVRAQVQAMVLQMARGERPWDAEVQPVNKEVALWAESLFVLQRKYVGRGLVGEHYRLTNISGKPMRLAEQEFYRPSVAGVAIELHELTSGDSTDVFVVSKREVQ